MAREGVESACLILPGDNRENRCASGQACSLFQKFDSLRTSAHETHTLFHALAVVLIEPSIQDMVCIFQGTIFKDAPVPNYLLVMIHENETRPVRKSVSDKQIFVNSKYRRKDPSY